MLYAYESPHKERSKSKCVWVGGGVVDDITDHPCMSAPFCPDITPVSGSEQAQPGTSYSFYCLSDCRRRLATPRTSEELVFLTLTITSLRHTFSIRTGAGLPIPQKQGSGGGSLKHLLVTNGYSGIGPQRPDERTAQECVKRAM